MSRTSLPPAVFVCLAALGCGDGQGSARDADAGDAMVEVVADADAGDVDALGDAPDALDAAPKPPPVSAPGSRLVVAGEATLVGHGPDSCTSAPGAPGDRWCAFGRPAGDFYELWVVDATRAVAGAAIACDGSDASCLRVSKRLYKDHVTGFADTGFNGDTLVYGENPYAGEGTGSFVGVISAWRPGWTAGRALTTALGVSCVGHARSDAAMCFEHRQGDGVDADLTIELHAGHLEDATAPLPLPMMDTLLLLATTDAPGAPARVGYEVSPDGAFVAWSTRTTADPVEVLRSYQLGGKGAAAVVARDVSRWAIAPDGAAYYWLAGYNADVAGAPAGTLQSASFPGGGAATTLATNVGDLAPLGDKGLWFRSDVAGQVGALHALADRAMPAAATTVDTKVLAVLGASRDGARLLYAKAFTPVRSGPYSTPEGLDVVDLYVGDAAGDAPCVVAPTPAAVDATLSPAGDLVLWDRYDAPAGALAGVATTVGACASAPFAARLGGLLPAGDGAYAYLEDPDAQAREATLRYARNVNGALAPAVSVQTRAAPVFAPLAPALPALAYTVATGTAADGLYFYVVAPADAGAAP